MSNFCIILEGWTPHTPSAGVKLKSKIIEQLGLSHRDVEKVFRKIPSVLLDDLSSERAKEVKAVLSTLDAISKICPSDTVTDTLRPADTKASIAIGSFWEEADSGASRDEWRDSEEAALDIDEYVIDLGASAVREVAPSNGDGAGYRNGDGTAEQVAADQATAEQVEEAKSELPNLAESLEELQAAESAELGESSPESSVAVDAVETDVVAAALVVDSRQEPSEQTEISEKAELKSDTKSTEEPQEASKKAKKNGKKPGSTTMERLVLALEKLQTSATSEASADAVEAMPKKVRVSIGSKYRSKAKAAAKALAATQSKTVPSREPQAEAPAEQDSKRETQAVSPAENSTEIPTVKFSTKTPDETLREIAEETIVDDAIETAEEVSSVAVLEPDDAESEFDNPQRKDPSDFSHIFVSAAEVEDDIPIAKTHQSEQAATATRKSSEEKSPVKKSESDAAKVESSEQKTKSTATECSPKDSKGTGDKPKQKARSKKTPRSGPRLRLPVGREAISAVSVLAVLALVVTIGIRAWSFSSDADEAANAVSEGSTEVGDVWAAEVVADGQRVRLQLVTIGELIAKINFKMEFDPPRQIPNSSNPDGNGTYRLHSISADGVSSSKIVDRKLPESNEMVRMLVAQTVANAEVSEGSARSKFGAKFRLVLERLDDNRLRGAWRISTELSDKLPSDKGLAIQETAPSTFELKTKSSLELKLQE